MAAPKGNKNGIGNSGGKEWGKGNREKAATLKGLSLNWMIKVMNGKDKILKKQIVMRIAPYCLPQVIAGDDESPLIIKVINYARNNNSIPISTIPISNAIPTSATKIQNRGLEQEKWQVQDGPKPTDK